MKVKPMTAQRRADLPRALELLRTGRFVLDTGELSGAVFGPDGSIRTGPDWIPAWAALGELLLPMARFVRHLHQIDGTARASLEDYAGDDSRVAFALLDDYYTGAEQRVRGRRLVESLSRTVDAAMAHWPGSAADSTAVLGHRPLTAVEYEASTRILDVVHRELMEPVARVCGIETTALPAETSAHDGKQDDRDKSTWLGIAMRLPKSQIPGMVHLARWLGRNIFYGDPVSRFDADQDFAAALVDPEIGLPPRLAGKFSNAESRAALLRHRDAVEATGYRNSGIEAPGTTELDRRGLAYLFTARRDTPVMVLAPTSSGKSRFGQLAIAQAVRWERRRPGRPHAAVVVVVPTKALVTQFARELRKLFAGTEARDEEWVVVEGSRDYPQYDDLIRSLRFDVAVIIPEKLAAMMRNGMRMDRVPLLLVDELQHLVESARGPRLEHLLMEVFALEEVPRFIGLSASMSDDTAAIVERWFAANGVPIETLSANARLVPLTAVTVDPTERVTSPTHVAGPPLREARALVHASRVEHFILGNEEVHNRALNYRLALALILEILAEHRNEDGFAEDVPSMLVFVNGRRLAEDLAEATRQVIIGVLGAPPAPTRRDVRAIVPRFAEFDAPRVDTPERSDPDAADEDPMESLRISTPGHVRNQLLLALASGVGFHTASLNTGGRAIIEEFFRTGRLRIMFATDTLRLGVNLPTDIVINADLFVNASGWEQRLIDKDVLVQRLGRAGRFGHSRGAGIGYLLANANLPKNLDFSDQDREMLTGDPQSPDRAVRDQLKQAGGLYRAYVRNWSGGAEYPGPQNPAWFLEFVVQHLHSIGDHRAAVVDIDGEIDRLFDRTLAASAGVVRPEGTLRRLEEDGAIAGSPTGFRLTDVGFSVARNAIELSEMPTVRDTANAALEGAGPLTLLYLVCRSPRMLQQSKGSFDIRDVDSVDIREAVLAQLEQLRRGSLAKRYRDDFARRFHATAEDCIGSGSAAEHLLREIDLGRRSSMTVDELTAAWRALHLYLRWTGAASSMLETRMTKYFDSLGKALPKPSAERWRVDDSTLTNLAENASYLLTAASDLLGIDPGSMQFRVLGFFAAEVEIGVPAALAPFHFLNHRGLGRDRILGMNDLLKDPSTQWDSLPELFTAYVDRCAAVPASSAWAPGAWAPLPSDVVADIVLKLEQYEERRRKVLVYNVSSAVQSLEVPGNPDLTVRDQLNAIGRGEGPEVVADMLTAFGLTVREHGDGTLSVSFPADEEHEEHSTTFVFPRVGEVVDNAVVDRVVERIQGPRANAMIVAVSGATHGVVNRGRFLLEPVAIIDPSLLVELLARVFERNSVAITADEDDEPWGSVFGMSVHRVLDAAAAGAELRRMFLHNAPVLSRGDLENRFAQRDVIVTTA